MRRGAFWQKMPLTNALDKLSAPLQGAVKKLCRHAPTGEIKTRSVLKETLASLAQCGVWRVECGVVFECGKWKVESGIDIN